MALVTRLQDKLNTTRAINQSDLNPVGMVVYADLTEVQFQALNGTGWILADGRNVAGSTYSTVTGNATVSDLRGVTIRSKNNGRVDGNQDPSGERALGSFQSHATAKNGLTATADAHTHETVVGLLDSLGPVAATVGTATTVAILSVPAIQNVTANQPGQPAKQMKMVGTVTPNITVGAGDAETRMRNVALNPFIKIN